LLPFIGVEVKGSKRWIDLNILPRFQPIELLKPFFIVLIASILSIKSKKKIYFNYFLSTLVVVPIILLLISQPDIGQTFLIIMTWLSLIFISGVNLIIFFLFFILISSVISYLVFFIEKFEYIKNRLLSFLESSTGNNYQSEKASEAIMNGGFFGQGIGEGTLNSEIPEAHTDYILSVISEEFGVIIVIVIMLIYLILAHKVINKIGEEKDNKIKLILLGSISLILLQTFVHIGVNIRILPTTGMTLPFLSYGGSSIISTAILSGIILNLSKRKIN
jgi:cell division protein FtsW